VKFSQAGAGIFVPDETGLAPALERTTHLGVGAHADDLEIMAIHGILEAYERPERWFTGVIVTDGVGGPSLANAESAAELRVVRRLEQERAAVLGKYGAQVFLDHSSAAVKDRGDRRVVQDLASVLRVTRPDVVYTHALSDRHDTHVAVALRLVAACRELGPDERPARLLGCEVWRDLDWLTGADRCPLPVDREPELQAALIRVFESQLAGKRLDLGSLGRRRANAAFAESHALGAHEALVGAMDLTPLLHSDQDPIEYLRQLLDRFQSDALGRVERLSS
jgi:LmbE family N-acetylglucosaminyl deacetylase